MPMKATKKNYNIIILLSKELIQENKKDNRILLLVTSKNRDEFIVKYLNE